MNKTSFSIIMPIYNTKLDLIRTAVGSALNINYDNYEIILIDDGSNTDVKELLKEYEESCVIKHQENKGFIRSCLEGIKIAKNDYIVFLDFDDSIDCDSLNVYNQILENNSVDIIMHDFVRFTDDPKDYTKHNPFFNVGIVSKNDAMVQLCKLHTNPLWCRCAKRSLYDGIESHLDKTLINGDDMQFSAYLVNKANSFYYTDHIIYYYRVSIGHRDYYRINNINDCNFLTPVYHTLFDNNENEKYKQVFKVAAVNEHAYNAFRICLFIKDKKEKYKLLNELNDLEITILLKKIDVNLPFITNFLYKLIINRNYFLLNIMAKIYHHTYGMQEI